MKLSSTLNWMLCHEQRLKKIKTLQQRKIANDFMVLKVKSATLMKRKQRAKNTLFRRPNKKSNEELMSFQEALAPILVMAQIFSLMPVQGITSKSVQHLKFSWWHRRTFYSLFVLLCFGTYASMTIAHAFHLSINFGTVEITIFYCSTFLIGCAFFSLARQWPKLMQQWAEVESKLPVVRMMHKKSLVTQRIRNITILFTMLSVVEHILSIMSIYFYVNNCLQKSNGMDGFFYLTAKPIFYFIPYNTILGALLKILNILSTFAWNYNDIFVMIVSTALSMRFRQLNDYMLNAVKRPTTPQFWIECRMNYRNLCKLCDTVDDAISSQTMLCFSSNLFFVCAKILKSIQPQPSLTHTFYFWYSLLFLLCRTFILALYTANINDESKRPMSVFRGISREYWCPELKRFSEEVSSDVVALSGMKFFQLTRGLVLSVAGTIVTYELVLLQFSKQDTAVEC